MSVPCSGGFLDACLSTTLSSVHSKVAAFENSAPGLSHKLLHLSSPPLLLQDILNHVFDDLDGFMRLLTEKAAAWAELEKKKKKSRRKKADCECSEIYSVSVT